MGARRGVTLTESLAVVTGIACLVAVLVPTLQGAKDAADRAVCARNLWQLGQALLLYANDHEGYLPDCGAASPLGGAVPRDRRHSPSRFDAPGTCAWPHVRAVGNQANLWILVRERYAEPGLFICPATSDKPSLNRSDSPGTMGFYAMDLAIPNHPTPAEDYFLKHVAAGRCSYSYQNQFAHPRTDPGVSDSANATTHRLIHPPMLAILADRNPYTRPDLQMLRQPILSPDEAPAANSLNHHGAGQNVLYLGGRVEWHETPECGPLRPDGRRDNIYRPDAGRPNDPENIPRSRLDSFLVP